MDKLKVPYFQIFVLRSPKSNFSPMRFKLTIESDAFCKGDKSKSVSEGERDINTGLLRLNRESSTLCDVPPGRVSDSSDLEHFKMPTKRNK